ncbi:hypothetical protein SDJN03_15687, partial [Cucurbita argyrosperma subsp. sororia]
MNPTAETSDPSTRSKKIWEWMSPQILLSNPSLIWEFTMAAAVPSPTVSAILLRQLEPTYRASNASIEELEAGVGTGSLCSFKESWQLTLPVPKH